MTLASTAADPKLVEQLIHVLEGRTPFVGRRKLDKSGGEVVQLLNKDWEKVTTAEQKVISTHKTESDAIAEAARQGTLWKINKILTILRNT